MESLTIECKDLGKSYQRQWLFRHLNATFKSGHSYAILGDNGSGKSTLTLLFAGQISPSEGTIQRNINEQLFNEEAFYKYYSLCSPALELIEEFHLEEWVKHYKNLRNVFKDFEFQQIVDWCEFNKKTAQRPFKDYSSGMKQRVKLITAFLTQSPLLVLDEPLTNLDQKGGQLFEKLWGNYTSDRLVLVASNREDEYQYCQFKWAIKSETLTHL